MAIPVIFHGRGPRSLDLAQQVATAVEGELWQQQPEITHVMRQMFEAGRPIIALMSSAIVIRALAPALSGKRIDPPVLCISPDGEFVIPLLSQHHGGNRLAMQVAAAIGGQAVVTTASNVLLDVELEEPPEGYELRNFEDYKAFASALLSGEPVRIVGEAPWLSKLPQSTGARLQIRVTDEDGRGSHERLIFHPRTLVVGIGCERGTGVNEVRDLVYQAIAKSGIASDSIACVASIDLKEDEEAIFAYRDDVRFFSKDELAAQAHRVANPSSVVMQEIGIPSVAEAAALACAGPESELVLEKMKSKRATVAIARARQPILSPPGRERGRLHVVGLGPGNIAQRTSAARNALSAATDWVGYSLYLDLAQNLQSNQNLHSFALGEEEVRVRHAIALAKQGKRVALICSGDAGIYAMASLVYEIIDREPCRIAVEVIPGISAFQAAAAKAGAMIGHDFCCISLSDLLTPWEAIERRIRAAAEGDFVVSFYNPRSLKRRDQLERAMAILGGHRPPETPVVIASNLGRPEERVKIVRFDAFDPDEVDMLTLVMVGSSQSRSFQRGDGKTYAYTPRGYASKRVTS